MPMGSRLTVIVPYRQCRTGIRRRNLGVVLRHLSALPVDVIVSEHDERPSLTWALPPSVRHVHVPASGGFSKSAACNAGFAASDGEIVAFLDADLLLDPTALVGSAARCRRDVDVVRPFGWLVDLDAEESAHIASSGIVPEVADAEPSDRRGGESIPLCGGAFVIRRDAFADAGGMDEEFSGWGGEDDAMSVVLGRLGVVRAVARRRPALHLWHERTPDRTHNRDYSANLERLRHWRQCSAADFAAALESRRQQGFSAPLRA